MIFSWKSRWKSNDEGQEVQNGNEAAQTNNIEEERTPAPENPLQPLLPPEIFWRFRRAAREIVSSSVCAFELWVKQSYR
jgi:hypothetical protein